MHYYFGTKAALADAIFERALGEIVPKIFGILADPGRTIEEKIPAIVREQIAFHSERPYFAGYMVSELHGEPDRSSASWPGGARSRWTCSAGSCARRPRPAPCAGSAPSSSWPT